MSAHFTKKTKEDCPMGIYYFKRRPLFFNPVPIEDIPEEYRKPSDKKKKQI